jgi:hypothetical protein
MLSFFRIKDYAVQTLEIKNVPLPAPSRAPRQPGTSIAGRRRARLMADYTISTVARTNLPPHSKGK